MTDQIDQITDTDVEEIGTDAPGRNKRRMFIAGAGLAGAAAMVGSKSASAADGDPVNAGESVDSTLRTGVINGGTNDGAPGTAGNEALYGEITEGGNGSHAVRGVTAGTGHGVAGENTTRENTVGATWGRHSGLGAGISGVNIAEDVDVAGTARGVEGVITQTTNGSHAVFGTTVGGGHAVAGVIGSQSDLDDEDTIVFPAAPIAATWGRHYGPSAAIEGQQLAVDIDVAGTGNAVRGLIERPSNGSHAVLGVTAGGGHSIAGDTPADAAGPGGVGPNTTAATWGRHGGAGAGIGGINTGNGYGGEFIGGKSHLRLIQETDAPAGPPEGDDHLLGELYADGAGDLFYYDGSTWVPLTQGGRGGTVIFENPARASDTRAGSTPPNTDKTKYGVGETREVDLSVVPGFPAAASGVLVNLTVANTEGFRGFATIFNGDTDDGDRPNTSNINWTADTQVIANSSMVRANADGVIKIYTSQPTDVIVDVQGYIA